MHLKKILFLDLGVAVTEINNNINNKKKYRNKNLQNIKNGGVGDASTFQLDVSNRWTGLWTGLLDWITGSNQTTSKSDDARVAHSTASKAKVYHCYKL